MLTRLEIHNFKAWRKTGPIRLAPITVFFGPNSSGKTSLLQLLLMLKQTVESPDRQRVLHPGDDNTAVDLGTLSEVIFRDGESVDRPLFFNFRWGLPQPLVIQDSKNQAHYQGSRLDFAAETRFAASGTPQVEQLRYRLFDQNPSKFRVGMRGAGLQYQLSYDGFEPVLRAGRSRSLPPPVKFYGFPDEAVAYYQNTGFLADLTLELERLFRRILYLGPLRGHPERAYVWSGEQPGHVGWRGERSIEAILASRDRRISPGYKRPAKPFEAMIAHWLQEMGLIESFRVQPIAEGRKEYEVLLKTRRGSDEVNLADVGFGISQVLPVLVQCFYAPANSILILEQPEIHLHPRVQASLADLFIETIHAREDGKNRNLQLLVESHSEHFLRRLQRRIAEEKLRPEEVAIYFCEPSTRGSKIQELEIDLFGNIRNWPEDFFGDEMGDLAAMTEAAMTRQAQGARR